VNRFGAVVLFIICVGMIVWASAWQLVDVKGALARQAMAEWYRTGSIDALNSWGRAEQQLQDAVGMNPFSSERYLALGNLYEWRAVGVGMASQDEKQHRTRATQYYRNALRLRPSWTLVWTSLAINKALAGDLDDELSKAIIRSLHSEPWNLEIQRRAILAAMLAWEELPEMTRESVFVAVRRAIGQSQDDRLLRNMAMQYGLEWRWEKIRASSRVSDSS